MTNVSVTRLVTGKARPTTPAQRTFIDWYRSKPGRETFESFCQFAHSISKRRDHYSADAIMHTVRTNAVINGHRGTQVNNNVVAYAARLYMEKFPTRQGFFRVRSVTV